MKHSWKAGIAAVLVLGVAAAITGMVAAQTDEPTPPATETETAATPDASDGGSGETARDKGTRRDEYLDALAANLGVTRDALDSALTATALEMVDKALADGEISEDEATRIRERINSGEAPLFPAPGFGHAFGKAFKHGFHVGVQMEDLAAFLGTDVATIRDGLMNDQSLAEIAEANGKSREELKAHLTAAVEERLASLVADGEITQEEADEKLASLSERLDEVIDRTGPIFHRGPGGPGGPHFHKQFGDGEGDDSTTESNVELSALTL